MYNVYPTSKAEINGRHMSNSPTIKKTMILNEAYF